MGKLFKHKHHNIIYSGEKFKVTLIYNNSGYKKSPSPLGAFCPEKKKRTQETMNSVRPTFRVCTGLRKALRRGLGRVGDIFPRQMKNYEGDYMQSRGMVHVQSCKRE